MDEIKNKQEILNEFYNSDWFLERPENIKELFKKYPITEEFFLRIEDTNDCYGVRLLGFEQFENNDNITARIMNDGPFPPNTRREVFDVEINELLTATQIKELNIVWHTADCLI